MSVFERGGRLKLALFRVLRYILNSAMVVRNHLSCGESVPHSERCLSWNTLQFVLAGNTSCLLFIKQASCGTYVILVLYDYLLVIGIWFNVQI